MLAPLGTTFPFVQIALFWLISIDLACAGAEMSAATIMRHVFRSIGS
jgi:hypothetical protein